MNAGDAALTEPLAKALAEADPRTSRGIAVGLRHIGPAAAPAVPPLLNALQRAGPETNPHLVNAYLAALREIRRDVPGLGGTLAAGLADDSPLLDGRSEFWHSMLKSHLFVTLGTTGNAAQVKPAILSALRGENPYIAAGAARAVAELGAGGEFAVEALIRLIGPEVPDRYMMLDHLGMTTLKAEAVKALAGIGSAAGPAIPALEKLRRAEGGYPPLPDMAAAAIRVIVGAQ